MAIAQTAPPSLETLQQARKVEILDKDGEKHVLGDLIGSKKVALIFIRHFWCGICQAYIQQLGQSLPPSSLPADTTIIVIGCGNYQPIQTYTDITSSAYPIYANPGLELYRLFEFKSNLGVSKKGEEREYEKDLGSSFTRVWSALKKGPMKHFEHVNSVGPKSLNGGEMVIQQDGTCSFFHRMQHTADHAELKDLAEALGATYTPITSGHQKSPTCESGVKV